MKETNENQNPDPKGEQFGEDQQVGLKKQFSPDPKKKEKKHEGH